MAQLKNIIIFWSGPYEKGSTIPSMEFGDNSGALFDYMIKSNYNEKWKLIYLVEHPNKYKDLYGRFKNVRFLWARAGKYGTLKEKEEYKEVLRSAQFIFTTDGYGFAADVNPGQIRVQLWHGCGIKTRVNFGRMEDNYEFMTVSSEFYKYRHAEIFGLRDDQVIITGLPKNDLLFHPLKNWQQILNVPIVDKYVFWLPTFRTVEIDGMEHLNEKINSGTGLPIVDSANKLEKLENLLDLHNMCLIIKLHPFQKRRDIHILNYPHIVLLENNDLTKRLIQIEHILGNADALISDYSSVAISYCILDRPLAFTLDDYVQYGEHRGFHWKNVRDYLPGAEIFNFVGFCNFIEDIAEEKDVESEKRIRLMPVFHKYKDDKSSERVLSYFGI